MTPLFPSYREIPLTQGQVAIVDEWNYAWLRTLNWYALISDKTGSYYATTNVQLPSGRRTTVSMHRLIMGLRRGDKTQIDHKIRHLTLDNRESNLRVATHIENNANHRVRSDSTTGLRGVHPCRHTRLIRARIGVNGKSIHLGYFETNEDAHEAYRLAAIKYYGEFASFG